MKASPRLGRIWHWVRWPFFVLLFGYGVIVGIDIILLDNEAKTQEAVAQIHAQKLTLADVMGETMVRMPDPALVDATVEGLDSNNNGIRDDVEIAIYQKYPNSARVRAAELQYAMTEQMYLTKVFNTETWKAVTEKSDRGYRCISETYPRTDLKTFIKITDERANEVENLIFNTKERKEVRSRVYNNFATTYGELNGEVCDIALSTLPN